MYSTRSLIRAGQKRGHDIYLLDYFDCSIQLVGGTGTVWYKEEPVDYLDAIIPRIGASGTAHGVHVIQQFESMGLVTTLTSSALHKSRDKLRCLQIMSEVGIDFPQSIFGSTLDQPDYLIEAVGGCPVVIKTLKGTHGHGVVLAKDESAAFSIIETFQYLKEQFMVQEFINESKGEDLRALVVGDQVIAAMKRTAMTGDFRANLHRGGSALPIKLSKQEKETALLAVQSLGIRVAGVDMLQSERGPLLLEVNPSPGLEGIETTTHIDVASRIIMWVEQAVAANKTYV